MVFIPLILLACSYHATLRDLVLDWWIDPNYSHGFFILPLAVYMGWEKRKILAGLTPDRTLIGIPLVLSGIAFRYIGEACSLMYLWYISFLLWFYGSMIFLFGLSWWRSLAFPMVFLLFMIPLPYLVYDAIAFPMKGIATVLGAGALELTGVPVLREGNILILPNMSLEVADACSGIRSLHTLLALGSIVVYYGNRSLAGRIAVLLSTIPISIFANSLRIYTTGLFVAGGELRITEGILHGFSGWLVFLSGFAMIIGLSRTVALFEKEGKDPSR